MLLLSSETKFVLTRLANMFQDKFGAPSNFNWRKLAKCMRAVSYAEKHYPKIEQRFWNQILDVYLEQCKEFENVIPPQEIKRFQNWRLTRTKR